jgi:hypothetical protein
MQEFNTVDEALNDIKNGKIIMVILTGKMKVILYVRQNMPLQKMLILWQPMEKGLSVCQ